LQFWSRQHATVKFEQIIADCDAELLQKRVIGELSAGHETVEKRATSGRIALAGLLENRNSGFPKKRCFKSFVIMTKICSASIYLQNANFVRQRI
jgi:hypothetical protein